MPRGKNNTNTHNHNQTLRSVSKMFSLYQKKARKTKTTKLVIEPIEECSLEQKYFDLRNVIPKDTKNKITTTKYIIADIFERNQNKLLSQKEITTEYGNKWYSIKGSLPGDLQRGLRTFYDKAKLFGVNKIGHNQYIYKPIIQSTNIICEKDTTRTFTSRLREKIIDKYNRKCAYCKNDTKYVKEVIDHWIPHNDNGKTLFENGKKIHLSIGKSGSPSV